MPKAVAWYRAYSFLIVGFNAVLFLLCGAYVAFHDQLANELISGTVNLWAGLLCAPMALGLVAYNVRALRSKNLRNPWSVHMGNIAIGICTCVLAPIALPLLLAWFRPEVRQWYADSG